MSDIADEAIANTAHCLQRSKDELVLECINKRLGANYELTLDSLASLKGRLYCVSVQAQKSKTWFLDGKPLCIFYDKEPRRYTTDAGREMVSFAFDWAPLG